MAAAGTPIAPSSGTPGSRRCGVGVGLSGNVIGALRPGGSAELTGALRVGDHICVVNDTVVGTMGSLKDGVTMNMVTDLLAGPEDSTVEIGCYRKDEQAPNGRVYFTTTLRRMSAQSMRAASMNPSTSAAGATKTPPMRVHRAPKAVLDLEAPSAAPGTRPSTVPTPPTSGKAPSVTPNGVVVPSNVKPQDASAGEQDGVNRAAKQLLDMLMSGDINETEKVRKFVEADSFMQSGTAQAAVWNQLFTACEQMCEKLHSVVFKLRTANHRNDDLAQEVEHLKETLTATQALTEVHRVKADSASNSLAHAMARADAATSALQGAHGKTSLAGGRDSHAMAGHAEGLTQQLTQQLALAERRASALHMENLELRAAVEAEARGSDAHHLAAAERAHLVQELTAKVRMHEEELRRRDTDRVESTSLMLERERQTRRELEEHLAGHAEAARSAHEQLAEMHEGHKEHLDTIEELQERVRELEEEEVIRSQRITEATERIQQLRQTDEAQIRMLEAKVMQLEQALARSQAHSAAMAGVTSQAGLAPSMNPHSLSATMMPTTSQTSYASPGVGGVLASTVAPTMGTGDESQPAMVLRKAQELELAIQSIKSLHTRV